MLEFYIPEMGSLIIVSNWTRHVSQYTLPWISKILSRFAWASAKKKRAETTNARALAIILFFFSYFLLPFFLNFPFDVVLLCLRVTFIGVMLCPFYIGEGMRGKWVFVIFVWFIFILFSCGSL